MTRDRRREQESTAGVVPAWWCVDGAACGLTRPACVWAKRPCVGGAMNERCGRWPRGWGLKCPTGGAWWVGVGCHSSCVHPFGVYCLLSCAVETGVVGRFRPLIRSLGRRHHTAAGGESSNRTGLLLRTPTGQDGGGMQGHEEGEPAPCQQEAGVVPVRPLRRVPLHTCEWHRLGSSRPRSRPSAGNLGCPQQAPAQCKRARCFRCAQTWQVCSAGGQ